MRLLQVAVLWASAGTKDSTDYGRAECKGGGVSAASHTLKESTLSLHCPLKCDWDDHHDSDFRFIQYVNLAEAAILCDRDSCILPFNLPLHHLSEWLTWEELRNMATVHGIRFTSRDRKPALAALFTNHKCDACDLHVSLFQCHNVPTIRQRNCDYKKKSCQKFKASDDSTTPAEQSPQTVRRSLLSSLLRSYCVEGHQLQVPEDSDLRFVKYVPLSEAINICHQNSNMIPFHLPIQHLAVCLTLDEMRKMATLHNIIFHREVRKPALQKLFTDHNCNVCKKHASVFESCDIETRENASESLSKFPPSPTTCPQIEQIVNDFCADTSSSTFEESGCAVCGRLWPHAELTPFQDCACDLSLLIAGGVIRKERLSTDNGVEEHSGPVVDKSCTNICETCIRSLGKGKVPKQALANGFWLGSMPDELKELTLQKR